MDVLLIPAKVRKRFLLSTIYEFTGTLPAKTAVSPRSSKLGPLEERLFSQANGDKEEIRTERLVGGVSNSDFRDTERGLLKMFNAASRGSPNVSDSR